ncbi:MAG: hypothetical protein ACI8QZ_004036 [Chlamydiales bacterium]|jgi:hypothetical protein
MNESNEQLDPLQELWGSQQTAPVEADIATLRTQAEDHNTAIRKRNQRETLVALALAGIFLLMAIAKAISENLVSAGGALLVSASMLWVRYAIRRWGHSEITPEDLWRDGRSFLALYRRELVLQRRLLQHAWLWYVLPIFGGIVLGSWGGALQRHEPVESWLGSISLLATLAVALGIVVLNLVAARGLGQQLAGIPPAEEA